MDTHNTELSQRLSVAKLHILADRKIWKRLRYLQALLKVGEMPTDKQAAMIASDILPFLERQGVILDDFEGSDAVSDFYQELMATAWREGDLLSNFRVLKQARENTK